MTLLVTDDDLPELQREQTRRFAVQNLKQLKADGIKRAEILAAIDNKSCPACLDADGSKWPIDKALREMPIPHEGDGHCRCTWAGVV